MPNTPYYGYNLDILRQHIPDESVDWVYLPPLTPTILEMLGGQGFDLPPRPPSYQPAQQVRRPQSRQGGLVPDSGPGMNEAV